MGRPEGTRDDDDPATLASRFLDLWQEEIAGTGRGDGPGALTLHLAALHLAALAGGEEGGGLNAGTDAGTAAPGSGRGRCRSIWGWRSAAG